MSSHSALAFVAMNRAGLCVVTLISASLAACVGVEMPTPTRDSGARTDRADVGANVDAGVAQDVVADERSTMDTGVDAGVSVDTGVVQDVQAVCTPACRPGHRCDAGTCRCGASAACALGQECCGDTCVDNQTTVAHCGRCGNACMAGGMCTAGVCIDPPPMCSPACDAAQGERCVAPGVCGCGASGARCAAGEVCTAGVCGPACPGGCPTGEMCVGRACVCGTTGATCARGTSCRGGRCLRPDECFPACASGQLCCSGACVPSDASNCGRCGTRCTPLLERCCMPLGVGSLQCTPSLVCP